MVNITVRDAVFSFFLYQNEYVELATGNAHGVINGFDPIKSYQTFLCNDVSLNKWYCENTGR